MTEPPEIDMFPKTNFYIKKSLIMHKRNKNFLNKISVGDILHYCPKDLKKENHDIGIIYEINKTTPIKFKIFWQKTQIYDEYSEKTLNYKLNQIIRGNNMMILISVNENK